MEEYTNKFPYLEISFSDREVRYMGYVLPLTWGEYEVLKAVLCYDGYLDKNAVKNAIDADVSTDVKMSVASIPIHVFLINRKAMAVGGRKLVGFKKNKGYFINESM